MDQTAAARIISLYQENALAFDHQRTKSLFERPWLERFLALVPNGGTILDIGCGSGEPMTRAIAAAGYDLCGVDAAPAMIELCRNRMPDCSWHVADMRTLSLHHRFPGILAWDSLFHLTRDDQRSMFPIFLNHAGPGAALMFTSGPCDGISMVTWQGEPLYSASLAPEEYRVLLAAHGFAVVAHEAEDPACCGHTVWLAQRRAY